MKTLLRSYLSPLIAMLANLLLAYIVYMVARIAFLMENWQFFTGPFTFDIFKGSLVFDTTAILLTHIPYFLMMLFPLHLKETDLWHQVCKWYFLVINMIALAINLMDAAYFPYTMRRTTTTVFSEFENEKNLGSIFFTEALHHWYFFLLAIAIGYALWRWYVQPQLHAKRLHWLRYDIVCLVSLLLWTPLVVGGIRGGFATAVRPITISNANQYVESPSDAAFVLNTPFSLYRTIGKAVFEVPNYFDNPAELEAVYSPIHTPVATAHSSFTNKNVVVIIIESFGREYIGALNRDLENGQYKGYTPFVDSLIAKSTTFKYSFCNGRKSIDGMPSILSSIPMFVEPFILTPASMNQLTGIAGLLGKKGYQTAFFHGAQRGSMGFMAFSKATGFQEYYGREDYDDDKRFGGDKDFDGMWAIWDEPFLQYYATKMSDMKEPFMTAVFTASSHHPYQIPEKYQKVYPEEGIIIHKCIRYTDMALRKFFEKASKEPWFKNTIFVLTSDHTNLTDHAYYQTDIGGFCSPIIIYEPGSDRQPEMQDKIAQQIDILPTLMGMLHYDEPYFGFGIDLLNTAPEDTWAVNYLSGIYQYVKHGLLLQFDGTKTRAVYELNDSLLQRNIIGQKPEQSQMERELKAIIQQYMERMTQDRLLPNK